MVTHPLLIAKQMAAHNPFLQADHFYHSHWWPGNDRVTFMEMPPNEAMNAVLIQMVSWTVATAGCKPSWWSLMKHCFNSHSSLKIKGSECVAGNENGKIV